MLKIGGIALGVTLGVAIFLAGRWYLYVTAGANPHDAEGVSLNALMPEPLNRWGCRRLHARFPEAIAPEGCRAGDGGGGWRG